MAQQDQDRRSYRAAYHPKDQNGYPVASETGVLPSIRLQAPNAEAAAVLAAAMTGCVISQVERMETSDPTECEVAE